MTSTMNRPIPELLGRRDTESFGEWVVQNCPPTRGVPATAIEQRIMRVPMGDDPLSRAVTIHEMVHAKVSPRDLTPWVGRGRASTEAMIAVEELRVNYLAVVAGFPMTELLDGSEEAMGERVVAMNSWTDAVHMAVATANTGGHKKFLSGVRRHNRTWASVLGDIAKRAVKEMKKSDGLARTDEVNGIFPYGFIHTERLAEWIDRLADNAPNDKSDDDKSGDSKSDDSDSSEPKKRGRKPVSEKDKDEAEAEVSKSRRVNPVGNKWGDALIDWFPLKVEKCPTPVVLSGHMGKKRVASPTGKSPRRLHRYLSDPDKRIFDRVVRGKGGVVVFDASGSMRVTPSEVKRVVESAPGATVIAYSMINTKCDDQGTPLEANCWVLANNGRMIDEMPYKRGAGNGVDLPALRYALTYRKRSTTPFVWVSDAQVTGRGDSYSDALLVDTTKFVLANDVIVCPNVETAITTLRALIKGERVKRQYPGVMHEVWHRVTGQRLP